MVIERKLLAYCLNDADSNEESGDVMLGLVVNSMNSSRSPHRKIHDYGSPCCYVSSYLHCHPNSDGGQSRTSASMVSSQHGRSKSEKKNCASHMVPQQVPGMLRGVSSVPLSTSICA